MNMPYLLNWSELGGGGRIAAALIRQRECMSNLRNCYSQDTFFTFSRFENQTCLKRTETLAVPTLGSSSFTLALRAYF